jgi:hypothetical protein
MLKDSWGSVLTWSSISTCIFSILFFMFSSHMEKSVKGVLTLAGALFVTSFFLLTILLIIVNQLKIFKEADSQGRLLMIVIFLSAIAYVLPKAIANFKK